ncbi:hypothetical protein RCG19_23395 [Neobacillus sp. OS1-2]|uniref:hypothetical protein n=1 Tax=Neobacillus sp. OS1-2 TaxID=3070680 RepID=UPI0027E216EE|nr:hypothetical protein [Neobacillus sp. OS1-2]WML42397.1 hypothetical protein RCG19_23395 [Neobacillus sp. OS1-2]
MGEGGIILFASLLMPIFEKLSEVLGLFVHADSWHHMYTFFGYLLFLTIITLFFDRGGSKIVKPKSRGNCPGFRDATKVTPEDPFRPYSG